MVTRKHYERLGSAFPALVTEEIIRKNKLSITHITVIMKSLGSLLKATNGNIIPIMEVDTLMKSHSWQTSNGMHSTSLRLCLQLEQQCAIEFPLTFSICPRPMDAPWNLMKTALLRTEILELWSRSASGTWIRSGNRKEVKESLTHRPISWEIRPARTWQLH